MHIIIKQLRLYPKLLVVFFSMVFALQSFAYESTDPSPDDPGYVIKTTLDKIVSFSTASDKVNPERLRGFIEKEIIPHFDFDNMSHWITGRYARYMSDGEKADFQRNLRETFLSSLARHLGSFDAENTRVKFFPARYRGSSEAFVNTDVYRPDVSPVELDFRMKLEGNEWKIIDIKANGASAVLFYRNHFMNDLRKYQRQRPAYRRSYD